MTLSTNDFREFHEAVHGFVPFNWQTRLVEQITQERRWPRVLDLPTGSGKTTCLDIALFALALDASEEARWAPRRIAMVVDRRIVVDQVADRGRRLLRCLVDPKASSVVREVATRLRSLSRNAEEPLGVFTLRGGMPKDDGWARTPDQPLILASTVDQLGSRLLIQGYGVSQGMKPVHAGLLANDTLVLLDEVHLSQPFAETLDQLATLRRKFSANTLPERFQHAFLSATPGAQEGQRFSLTEQEMTRNSALGARLHAKKPVSLRKVSGREEVERAAAEAAREFIAGHAVVAVIVNRIASATNIATQLHSSLGEAVDVVTLTGRMRPLDRDDVLRELRPRVRVGRDRSPSCRKLIVVGTQCLEAGADFDFDALVSEAASFDALRQRFGRVDRTGAYGDSEGVIVFDKSAKDDPIYGGAIQETSQWIEEQIGKKKSLDFGVLALPAPSEDALREMLAAKPNAPVMLPAYLDLWMQTSPAPVVLPEVGLWLHGPSASPPEVQVVWRVDLTEEDLRVAHARGKPELAMEIVAAVRPSSLEAVSLPIGAARMWLAGTPSLDFADVEGAGVESKDESEVLVLRWRADESEVIPTKEIRPGDTLVVPATRGGIRGGCFDPSAQDTVRDLAERAALSGRGQPVLRLQKDVLGQLGLEISGEDRDGIRAQVESASADLAAPAWRRLLFARLARGSKRTVVDAENRDSWVLLCGSRVRVADLRAALDADDTVEAGIELSTDDDDSYHAAVAVELSDHSSHVEAFARAYARGLGLPEDLVRDLALAGWLHDIGKADRRFQVMLRGGSEIDFFKHSETLLAKSGMRPGAKRAHRIARERSKYPRGTRHEIQSVAMVMKHIDAVRERAHDLDLVLHLVGSHHGFCRPFAPVAVDESPVDVALREHKSQEFGEISFVPTSSGNELYRLDSPLADRFWRLVEKYGWFDLCWLEAILRLADHRASEEEQSAAEAAR